MSESGDNIERLSDSSHSSAVMVQWPAGLVRKSIEGTGRRILVSWAVLVVAYVIAAAMPSVSRSDQNMLVQITAMIPWLCSLGCVMYILRSLGRSHGIAILGWLIGCLAIATVSIFIGMPDVVSAPLVLLAALLVGSFVTMLLDQLFFLLPVLIVAAIVDIWSVFSTHGITNKLLRSGMGTDSGSTSDHAISILSILAVPIPLAGLDGSSYLGFVDIAFAGCSIVATCIFGCRPVRTIAAVIVSIVATTILVTMFGALPALPLMSLSVLVVNMRDIWHDRIHVRDRIIRAERV